MERFGWLPQHLPRVSIDPVNEIILTIEVIQQIAGRARQISCRMPAGKTPSRG